MILLIGKSATGKSTVELLLQQNGWKRVVSYTSRHKRPYEEQGREYHFVDCKTFENLKRQGHFAETTIYNGNYYGAAKEDCTEDAVIVVELNGAKQIVESGVKCVPFYLTANTATRVSRMKARGDKWPNILKRIINDETAFKDNDWLVNRIKTDRLNPEQLTKIIESEYKCHLKEA